ncbi:MAG: hypothetical protein HYU36_19090 [Planctomycetes bacterium]|nr:hypothetical protein [Planctomycetota bacterium]
MLASVSLAARTSVGEEAAAHYVFQEAEEFQVVSGDWQVLPWGTNYYAATFANCFLSRQRYLGSPEQGLESEAVAEVQIPADGSYHVCVRYEACYNFETRFGLRIEQGGQTVLQRTYGGMNNVKLWAFQSGLKPQVRWCWGPDENVVWEGTDVTVALRQGPARLVLFKERQPAPAARRNVDIVVLTTDTAELNRRIQKEGYLPLDGLLTQAGDLYLKIRNPAGAAAPVALVSSTAREHSPYWVHIRNWKSVWIDRAGPHPQAPAETAWLGPGEESPWVEIGSGLDALNTCGYVPEVYYPQGQQQDGIDLEFFFGAPTKDGTPRVIRQLRYTNPRSRAAEFAVAGNVRYTEKIETFDEVLEKLLASVKAFPPRGRIPTRMLFFNTFLPMPSPEHATGDAPHRAELALDMCLALGNNVVNDMPGWIHPDLVKSRRLRFRQTGYKDCRDVETPKLREWVQSLRDKGQWPYIKVVSLGDEIGLGGPTAGEQTDLAFRAYLQHQGLKPKDLLPPDPALDGLSTDDLWKRITWKTDEPLRKSHPRLYYHARVFASQYGLDQLKERTRILEEALPKGVLFGANYSPHPHYHPHYFQWIELFRQRAMTLPWSEDYLWQIPSTSQQVLGYLVSALRCAAREHDLPILMYVMPHTPGNTPASFRRAFYADVAHGAKIFNFFEPIPTALCYTENSMLAESTDMYRAIYDVIHEAGLFEDLVFPGKVRPAEVGLAISNSTDIWTSSSLFNAERQHLYLALRHAQIPVDFISEEDMAAGKFGGLKIVYLVETHLKREAALGLRKWVGRGGTVFAAGPAGLRDEAGAPSVEMQKLLGVSLAGEQASVDDLLGKDTLPRLQPMDTLYFKLSPGAQPGILEVYAFKSVLSPGEGSVFQRLTGARPKLDVLGAFQDATPALFAQPVGSGKAITCAAFPGTAYVKPAIPDRPCDRGATDEAFNHFLPTSFNQEIKAFLARWALEAGVKRPIITSEDLVETSWIASPAGIAVPLVNYRGSPVPSLEVRVLDPGSIRHVSSGVRGELKFRMERGDLIVELPVDVADLLLLRRYAPE